MHVYDAVTTGHDRYVQGGGCATVGVAGLVQSGGFGSFSKNYGTAAAGLIEAEVVTADGVVRVVNACSEPDLFWALRGGGGGTFGIVTRVTLRTHALPEHFGGASATIRATSDASFRDLIGRFVAFYREHLFNPHWGEVVEFTGDNRLRVGMVFQGLTQQQAADAWAPFLALLRESPDRFVVAAPLVVTAIPARRFWDPAFLRAIRRRIRHRRRPARRIPFRHLLARRPGTGGTVPVRLHVGLAAGVAAVAGGPRGPRRCNLCGHAPLDDEPALQ